MTNLFFVLPKSVTEAEDNRRFPCSYGEGTEAMVRGRIGVGKVYLRLIGIGCCVGGAVE